MSGEYFCIEEVDPASYYEDFRPKSKATKHRDRSRYPKSREHDAKSTSSKKSQDLILYEIEEQLKVAENRCNTLKGHINSMKKIYQNTGKNETVPNVKKLHMTHEHKKIPTEDTFKRKISRKRSKSPPNAKSRSCTPSKRHYATSEIEESSDTIPHQSSSSSTNLHHHNQIHPHLRKADFATPLIRQNSASIGTDHSGAATRTMNSILTGIADSVNRITQIHGNPKEPIKLKKHEPELVDRFTEIGPSFQTPDHLSPRAEKRLLEQKRKVDEILKIKKLPIEVHPMDTWNPQKISATSMKSKTAKTAWSRHTRSKTPCKKTKTQFSSASVNITKPIKSTAKHVENSTKLRPMGTSMVEESPSLTIKRKRKRALKRLHPNSSKYETRKINQNNLLLEHPNASSNLIELYHNVAAKPSDSDESNHFGHAKSHATRQKGGGDLPITTAQIVPSHDNTEIRATSPTTKTAVNKIFTPTRVLTPINEHVYVKRIHTNATDVLSNMTRNYELPTIASKLKQVAKSYLSTFNFRKIPFCVAKSTTPSHNIGVNIQQVMSIMKTKQPVVGLSPTLAHNIGLAAGKFHEHHDNPLSALVSTLSTKMAYRQSHCPLSLKTNVNYCQLQEMAKTIEEEPCEDRPGLAGDAACEAVIDNVNANKSNEVEETKQTVEPPEWTIDPGHVDHCTCAPQKGVPFHEVLNRYHLSSECVKNNKPSHVFKTFPQQRQVKSTYGTTAQKNRTKNWVNATNPPAAAVVPPIQSKNECADLQGKEKNLKTVLTNLYDEFNNLNNKYEGLSKDINKNNVEASELTLKELEEMENMLNKKEEEINMVMSLYTEVLALKDQVRKLREKASQSAFTVNSNSNQQVKVSEYKEPSTAAHLTQLLRQIQNYQIHCKSKVN